MRESIPLIRKNKSPINGCYQISLSNVVKFSFLMVDKPTVLIKKMRFTISDFDFLEPTNT